MKERSGLVTINGNPMTLVGNEVKVGDSAPEFEVLDNDLNLFRFSSKQQKITIITSLPSLDTSVCDMETRRFNQEASSLGDDVQVLAISMDLPFAQKRWCAAAGVKNVLTLSDHRNASFGMAYGVLIKEVRLLARAVFVVGKDNIVRYHELVAEVGSEPDYQAAFKAVRELGQ
jgi:thioredoxin-dependent peroxiredoxin